MKRRAYLASSAGLLGAVAGCTSSDSNPGAQGTTDQKQTTTTAATTETTTAEPAEFELASIQAPETAEIGDDASYSFTVTNVGERAGVFTTKIRSRVGDGEWSESDPWREPIDPGITTRLSSQSFTMDYLSSVDFEITAFDKQFSVRFVGAQQDWGDSYTVLDKYELNAVGMRFADSYTYESNGYEYEQTPSDGQQWAWLEFSAENVNNSPIYLPTKRDIALISGNSQYSYTRIRGGSKEYEGGEVQPDIVRNGEILYEVPESLDQSDFSVAYSEETVDGDVSVYWGAEDD